MKKILYIVSTLERCGPTNQLSYIIKYLDKSKFEPMVLTLSPEPKEDRMKNVAGIIFFKGIFDK